MGRERRRIAHDLRQPLAAAEMHAHLLGGRLVALGVADDDPAHEHLKTVGEQLRALALAIDALVDEPAAPAAEAAPDGGGPLAGALVALVDDDDAVRLGLQAVLLQAGAFVVAGAGLAELLAALDGADRMPDLILTDWRLGPDGGDGRAVIEALRQRSFGRALPALVLTAYERDAAQALGGMAGVAVLRKPVPAAVLVARLAAGLAESAP